LTPVGGVTLARSSDRPGPLCYASALALSNGPTRVHFEAARPDGSHDLMTCIEASVSDPVLAFRSAKEPRPAADRQPWNDSPRIFPSSPDIAMQSPSSAVPCSAASVGPWVCRRLAEDLPVACWPDATPAAAGRFRLWRRGESLSPAPRLGCRVRRTAGHCRDGSW
jgi:hypothetical protein